MKHYDAIVVGVGGVGSAALFHLAQRGATVLGLDRFAPGHDRGSSHGRSRLISRAYQEHPDYVPLVNRAWELWAELAEKRDCELIKPAGLVRVGPKDGEVLTGVRASAQQHSVPIEEWDAAEGAKHLPGFRIPEDLHCLFEKDAGILDVEKCVEGYAEEAIQLGAELRIGATVRNWSAKGSGVTVETESGQFTAKSLVVTAGPWAKDLLLDLCIPFEVRRKPAYWYETETEHYGLDKGCPAFLYDLPGGVFYGVPEIDEKGVKVAEHSAGLRVPDPLAVDRGLDTQDQKRVEAFLEQYLPGVKRRCTHHMVCMYTMSPDNHFVVDKHPETPNVVFSAGLSGHGFKFASVLGEAMADLVLAGKTDLPIDFLACDRENLAFTDID